MATVSWKFPKHYFLRIEVFFVVLLAAIIFLVGFFQFGQQWTLAVALTGMFLGIYLVVSHGAKSIQKVEHHYEVTPTHFQVTTLERGKKTQEKLPLKHLHHHKLDHFFLGGYLVSKAGKKHLIFFNTKKELTAFEKHLRKHLKLVK
jgi:hypothetical protein